MSAAPESARPGGVTPIREWSVRIVFLAVVLGCGVWSLDGRWDEVGAALRSVAPPALVGAVVLTCLGLAVTSVVWRRLLLAFGHDLPPVEARSVFFVSQLGKYVPGAVWAIGVQARLAAKHAVPVRVSVTGALMFTCVHLFTAGAFGAGLVLMGDVAVPGQRWLWALVAVAGVAAMAPPAWAWLVQRMAGSTIGASLADAAGIAGLMALTWATYATAVLLLVPAAGPSMWLVVAVAFTAGYVAGVVVVIAPAGLGAREAVFILVLSPVTGLPVAAAVALLARIVHAVADLVMAALGWGLAQRAREEALDRHPATVGGAWQPALHDDDRL